MLKYLFSHEILAKQFVDIATSYHIESNLKSKQKGWEVQLVDELDDLTVIQLNDYYTDLSKQDYELSHPREIMSPPSEVTINISLENGVTIETKLDKKILNKLTSTLNHDESNLLLTSIANAIQNQEESS